MCLSDDMLASYELSVEHVACIVLHAFRLHICKAQRQRFTTQAQDVSQLHATSGRFSDFMIMITQECPFRVISGVLQLWVNTGKTGKYLKCILL